MKGVLNRMKLSLSYEVVNTGAGNEVEYNLRLEFKETLPGERKDYNPDTCGFLEECSEALGGFDNLIKGNVHKSSPRGKLEINIEDFELP
jgi:hypothetical protein|tara:strand:- start:3400 stop:3669 length:270 start_codon:yes stop_codon:yes gene_type:complete